MITKAHLITPIALITLIGFGTFFRFESLNKQPYWMDEGYTINAIISQEQNGTHGFGAILDSGKIYFCPIYCYPTLALKHWLGDQPATYRALSALFGLIFILVVYAVTKEFFQRASTALLAAFFTAFAYWQIAWSRQARWYTLLETFFWLAILCFAKFLKADSSRTRWAWFGLCLLSTLLAITAQGIAYFLPPLFLLWYLFVKRPPIKYVAGLILGTIAFLLFSEKVLHLAFLQQTLAHATLNNNLWYYASFYGRTYWALIPAIVFVFICTTKHVRISASLLIAPFIAYLLPIAFFTDIVHYRYLFHTTPAFLMIAACAITTLMERWKQPVLKYSIFIGSVVLFFLTGIGIVLPKDFYTLEADDPATLHRSYYAYTPQPDFTAAYQYIRSKLRPEDLVISTQPQFNKLFLHQAGYWIAYDYLGRDRVDPPETSDKELYVNATIIHSQAELEPLMQSHHGYIVLDSMAEDGRLPLELIRSIQSHSALEFYDKKNSYSEIWVYRF